MQYMLMNYVNEAGWAALTKPQQDQGLAAYKAYSDALTKAGVLKGAMRVEGSAMAKTVRGEAGEAQVQDGPYAPSKEQFGGYFVIEAPDLDAAIAWAARSPTTGHGVVEVRPLGALSA